MQELLPCPFCGIALDGTDHDTLHKSNIAWKDTEHGKYYVGWNDECDSYCYEIHCNELIGGCGATITQDSIEEVIIAWNKRSK